jgi:hypothetical protein
MESRFAVHHTPPDEQDPVSTVGAPTQVCFLSFAVRHTPPDQQDPLSTVGTQTKVCFLRFAVRQTLPDEQDPVSTIRGRTEGLFPPIYGTPDLVSAVPSKLVGSR